ncbi:MAG: GNAT family N-acetyltransferase [Pseudoflavonifractor sp.]|nr:GNAT family N-acetyltransferase [Pseudoflavonifractor sp.]
MESQIDIISMVVDYIESNLNSKLDLDLVAAAVHYSKFHLHRMFTETVGLTIHEYAQRRQLTEAAKLLVFSQKPILEIAILAGYKSQQAFTGIFKAMYKTTPGCYRQREEFYPLQLRFTLCKSKLETGLKKSDIVFAMAEDISDWLELARLTIDGYPCLVEDEFLANLRRGIKERRALIMRNRNILVGAAAFSYEAGEIEFLAVHPQYRNRGVIKLFLDALMDNLLSGRIISITTYREGDNADTGYREELKRLGFAERELLIEFGYPTQRFELSPKLEQSQQPQQQK